MEQSPERDEADLNRESQDSAMQIQTEKEFPLIAAAGDRNADGLSL